MSIRQSQLNPLCSNSKPQISCELQPTQAQGRRVRSDQSPEPRENSGVEREVDLAKVDGSAGVRNSRENMEGVIEMDEGREVERRWKMGVVVMNKEIKLSSMVRGE